MSKSAKLLFQRNRLLVALAHLSNECFGSMGLEPELMRQAWGNTNVNILELRVREARELIAEIEKEGT